MNISDRTLTDTEVTVLQKGLNYAIPSDKENVPGFVASVENAVSNLRGINDEEKGHHSTSSMRRIEICSLTATTGQLV